MKTLMTISLIILMSLTNLYAIEPKLDEDEDSGESSKVEKEVKEILEKTHDEDFNREEIVNELAEYGTQIVNILLTELYNEDEEIVIVSAFALDKIYGEKALSKIVKAYIKRLPNNEIYELTNFIIEKEDKTLPHLSKEFATQEEDVRYELVKIIAKIETKNSLEILSEIFNDEPAENIKFRIIELTYEKDEGNQKKYLEYAYSLLDAQNFSIKCDAIKILGIAKDTSKMESLQNWAVDENLNIRKAAITALSKIGTESAIAVVINSLQHECKFTRFCAADMLVEVETKDEIIKEKIFNAMVKVLEDDYELVRLSGIVYFSKTMDKRGIPYLEKVAENDPDDWNMMQAKDVLVKLYRKF